MNYYLRFNGQLDASPIILAHFSEDFSELGRQIDVGIKVSDPTLGDDILASLMKYTKENTITSLEIVNDEDVIIYSTKAYNKAKSISLQLNLEQQTDDDFGLITPMSYSVIFSTIAEE